MIQIRLDCGMESRRAWEFRLFVDMDSLWKQPIVSSDPIQPHPHLQAQPRLPVPAQPQSQATGSSLSIRETADGLKKLGASRWNNRNTGAEYPGQEGGGRT